MDNGGTANGGVDTSPSQSFTINVTPVNDRPAFIRGRDQIVLEDSGPTIVAAWAKGIVPGPPNESSQTVTFLVSNNNPALFSSPPAITPNGTLSFTPAPNANGTATVAVRLKDNGGTANQGVDTSSIQTFTITVEPVNDTPSFVKGKDQVVPKGSGWQTVTGWATAISPGPPNESSQRLLFLVSTDKPSLFALQPTISPNGTLSYKPAIGATGGTAVVTVRLKDNGGTANGGQDRLPRKPSRSRSGRRMCPHRSPRGPIRSHWKTVVPTQWRPGRLASPPARQANRARPSAFLFPATIRRYSRRKPAIAPNGTLTYSLAPNANGLATVTVKLKDSGGTANGGVDTSAAQTFTITVTPVNDAPSFLKGADQNVNSAIGSVSVAGWATAISAGPSDESGQSLSFLVSPDKPSLFAVQPAITANGTLSFTPASGAVGTATVTVKLMDNGGTANGGQDTSAAQTFTITIATSNVPPSFTKGPNQVVLEDSGSQSVAAWATGISAGPASESSQTVSFLVSSDNSALFTAQPAIAPNGTLTYSLAPNANGLATVTVKLKDSGGTANGGVDTSAAQTFTITVTPVNDAPSFLKGADQNVNSAIGLVSVAGWATAISAGPSDESGQSLSFLVSPDKPSLFAVQPAITANGRLSFTPASGAVGTATVTVQLMDNGGTANGGQDTSAAQTFTITIATSNVAPSFTEGPNQVVLEDSGSQSVAAWATGISAGPANESSQTVNFLVSSDNSALFTAQPAIAPNGTLTYAPAPNANGSATVTVNLQDNGGTANGGVDTSAARRLPLP